MKSKRMYRLLSWILALTMVFSLTVSPVYASDTSSTITTVNADETEDETTVEEETTTDNSAAETLQAQIDALPSVERVSAMDTDAQNEVYAQVSTIWDAYYELTEAEQEQVDASLLEALSDYFNGLTVEAEETATVATIGENSYTSLADAIAAVTDSTQTTITLTTNVTESNGLTISDTQNIVLELSSYTLDLGSAYIEVKGILTIQGNGTITTSNDGEGVIYANGTSAKVTLSSGSITNTGSQGYGIGCWYGGTAVINGGSITSQSAALAGNNTTGNMNFEVNGGTLTTTYGAAIYMPGQGTLNITGGTINGGISLRMGQVTISGGTINATTNSSNIDSITEYYNYSGNVWLADAIYVFGGTYTSEDTTNGNSLSLSISGGTFNCTNGQGNAVTVYNLGKVEQTSTVTISGGTFTTDTKNGNGYAVVAFSDLGVTDSTGSYGTSNNTVSTSISGGTFTGDVSEYLVSGLTQDEDGKVVTDETAYVAQIGETKYATVTEAITAATDGTETTITLLTDTEEDVVIPAGKVIALDLNGKTIKNSSSHTITNYGTLTVTDSSTESTGTVNNVTHAKAAIVNYGTAYLYGGTFTRSAEAGSSSSNNGGNSYYTIKNYNQMTIGDGTGTVTVENNGCYSSCIANGYQNTSDKANAENITGSVTPTLTINENASVSGGINCVKNDDCATLIIKGGSFTNTNGVAIQNHSTATINGGTFTANTCAVYNCGCDSTLDVGSLTITNGTFEGGTYAVYDDSLEDVAEVIISGGTFTGSTSSIATSSSSAATFAISGGTFNSDVSEYAIEGYEATETSESGIYEITALTATSNGVVASVTSGNETTYYKSLEKAMNATTGSETVTLLDNVEVDEQIVISNIVTLDLAGYTVSHGDCAFSALIAVTADGNLTIKDSSNGSTGKIDGGTTFTNASGGTSACIALQVTGGNATLENGTLTGYYAVYATGGVFCAAGGEIVAQECDNSYSYIFGIYMANGADVILSGDVKVTATVETEGNYGAAIANFGGNADDSTTLTISGGTIAGTTYGISTNGSASDSYWCGNAVINISGGEISGTWGMYLPAVSSSTTISGGTITGSETGIEIRAGELTVTGGSIIGNGTPTATTPNGNGTTSSGAGIAISQHTTKQPITVTISGDNTEVSGYTAVWESDVQGNGSDYTKDITLTITGGTFTTTTGSSGAAVSFEDAGIATVKISGGTYSTDVTEYVIEGYEATNADSQDGMYNITALTETSSSVVASVTASDETITYYKSLANALNAATNGSTVTLLADVELNESLIFEPSDSDSVTLDLNGKTITFAYDDNNQFNGETLTDGAWGLKVVSGTLTIKDSSGDKMGSIQTYDEDTYVDVVGASGSAKLIIESGNFTTNSIYEAVVFATGSAKVEITGGTFTNSASGYEYNSEYTHGLTLNIGNSSSATISVTGGTFVGRSPAEGDDYVSTVTTFVADGYEATETSTGVYTVAAEISYVAVAYTSEVSNGTYYTTFDDVVAAIDDGTITDGMTIMLLDDATWTLTANKKITIGLTFDLNGKTLTLSGSKYVYFAPASSTSMVKFTDSSYTSGDLTGRVVGTYKSTSYGMIRFNNACNVVLENVSFENTSYACVMEIGAASGVDINLTANNCSFINSNTSDKYSSKIYSQGVLLYGNSTSATGTISFKNCTFQTSDDGENGAALKICQGKSSTVSPITIDGCTIVNNGTTTSCSALQFGTSLNSKVTVTNSTMTATTGYAVDAYYDITSTADITLGEGNIVNGVVNIRNGGTRNYTVNVTGGRFDNGTSDAIVAASDESTSTSILNLLNLTGGYFKTDVSDLVANGYACVANTAEAAGDAYNSIYADAGYTYTVAAVIGATDYYILDSSNEKHYFDSLSAALASTDYTGGTVYFAADCTLTASDLANINTYGWTVQNYGGATLTYEDTLSSLVSTLTSGNVEVTTLMYKYDDTTAHTISNVSITNGVLVSGTLSGIDCTDADNWAYYTTGILAEGYVYYLTGSTYTIESKDSVNAQAKIDDILYCRLLSKAVSTAVALNSSDTSVHTVTMLQNATTSISLSGGDTLILDMNGKTLTGYVYVNGTTSDGGAVTLKNGTITQSSNNNFVVYTNGTLKNVTLTLDNLTVTHNGSTGIAVYLAAGGTTTITDCTISGATGIVARSSDISITDTTVTATGEYGEYDNTYSGGAQSTGDAIILIASGYPGGAPNVTTFSGVKAYSNNGKAVVLETYTGITEESEDYFNTTQFIKDGYYSNDVTEYCVDGMCTTTTVYEVGDITYTYEISSAVASITVDGVTTYYSTIEKALAGAADGKTIVLLADVTVMSDAIISTSVTLDLNDFDFGVASGVSLTISEGKGVSIVDDGEDNSGIVYNYGIITVNGSLDISDLGYTTNGSSGGLMGQTNGKIVLGASSVFTVPGVWATQWSTYFASQYSTYTSDTTTNASLIGYSDCGTSGLWSPNVPSATGASGIFYSAEAGATVISGDNSWTCTTTFENLTENPSTLYWMMKKTQAKLYARSLTLDGSIGVNYYVDANGLTEDEMKGYTVKFTVDGTESTAVFDASSYRNDLNGSTKYYRFTVTVTALQMAKTITAELQYNGTTIQTNTYSVQQYCETAISGEWDEKDLCAALLNYGGYAQNYANSDISNLANANLLSVYSGWSDPVSSYDADLSSYADKVSVSETLPDEVSADTDGNHFYATLLMESKTVIRIYFNSSNASALTFKVDDITLDINSTADGDTGYGAYTYYVEFKVPANMLDETYTVTVTNGNTDGTITYSALAYVYNMVAGSTATDALKNVCKALYYYSIAAEAYTNWY